MVNKVRVTIAGAPYAIATTDSEKYILSLAKKLDEDITKLLDANANLSVTKAAVFCAMDYLDEYHKSAGSAENMRSQIQEYIWGESDADCKPTNNITVFVRKIREKIEYDTSHPQYIATIWGVGYRFKV